MVQHASETTIENLSRLASKPGVRSTLILSKTDGSIIRSTGLTRESSSAASTGIDDVGSSEDALGVTGPNADHVGTQKTQSAEEIARLVFDFVGNAQVLADGIADKDEVKLLRLRTKKHEIVIAPDTKFLLIVIQDAPQA